MFDLAVMTIKTLLKRSYEKPDIAAGFRVFVDRLWPWGKKKADLRLDIWAMEISPSTELRKWFGHDPVHWVEFSTYYKAELTVPEMKYAVTRVTNAAHKHSTTTLNYGAKNTQHNEAAILLPSSNEQPHT